MKKFYIPILLTLLISLFRGSYLLLRSSNVSNVIVILVTIALILIAPIIIYTLWIRPKAKPKLFIYLSFIGSVGATYLIPLPSQKYFLSQILTWLLPVLEVSIVIIVL